MLSTLATLAALAATPAPASPPTTLITITGPVTSQPAPQMFTVQVGDRRVLVYANSAQVQHIRIGRHVQVRGTVPADWLKLAADELQATDVQVQP